MKKGDFLVVPGHADRWMWRGDLDIHVIIITFLLKLRLIIGNADAVKALGESGSVRRPHRRPTDGNPLGAWGRTACALICVCNGWREARRRHRSITQ
ncbi:TPA: hypothetical protein ACGCF9_000122 [Stenotrophomonas maltophilia]